MNTVVNVMVLPSPILISGTPDAWNTYIVKKDHSVQVYPPFASGGPGRPNSPWVNVGHALKSIRQNGGHIKLLPPRRVVPRITEEPTTENAIYTIAEDSDHSTKLPIFPVETLSFETPQGLPENDLLNAFTRNIRRFTRQVWVGHAVDFIDKTSSCHIEFTEDRRGRSAVIGFGSFRFNFHSIRICTEEIWKEAWRAALEPQVEFAVDVVHDAHRTFLSHNTHGHYIGAGIAIERIKYILWDYLMDNKMCTKSQYRNAINDTKKPHRFFSEQLFTCTKRSLGQEVPAAESAVKSLWTLRGLAAHGRPPPDGLLPKNEVENFLQLYELAKFVDEVTSKKPNALQY